MHKYRELQKAQARKRRLIIVKLRDEGKSVEYIAELFSISKQRVSQLDLQEREGRKQR